jgi:hypothetical protein
VANVTSNVAEATMDGARAGAKVVRSLSFDRMRKHERRQPSRPTSLPPMSSASRCQSGHLANSSVTLPQ